MFEFDAELWLYDPEGTWHFITVPGDISDDIEARTAGRRRGIGSVRVQVKAGQSTWLTSVFPDRSRDRFILPVKKEIRTREGLMVGDRVHVALQIVDG